MPLVEGVNTTSQSFSGWLWGWSSWLHQRTTPHKSPSNETINQSSPPPFLCVYTYKKTTYTHQRSSSPQQSSMDSPSPWLWGLLGHHRWLHNQFPPFFSVLHCLLGLEKLQACPFPDVVFPTLFLSALSSSPFYCAVQWIMETLTKTQHAS